jgi:hypothetical protein
MGYWPNLESPKTFNEKIQWLKLYDRKPEYTQMVDKFAVREYIAKMMIEGGGGGKNLKTLLGMWNKFEDIDFEKLPNQFVLKCTHNSGGNIICKDKKDFNIRNARIKINWWLKHNYFYAQREWPYKNIKPRIIAEEYMVDESGYELKDYKFFCFNGQPKIVEVIFDRHIKPKVNVYSPEWEYLPLKAEYPNAPERTIQRPKSLEMMLYWASKLSAGKYFLRVDFYIIKDQIYFGELTLYPTSGYHHLDPPEWDDKLGSWIELSVGNAR